MILTAKFCRICMCSKSILKDINNEDTDGIKLIHKLKTCLPEIIQKETEVFNYICNKCCNELKQSYIFATRCMKNETLLLGYAEKLTQETKPDFIDVKLETLELPLQYDESYECSIADCDFTEVPLKCEPNDTDNQPANITKDKATSHMTKIKIQRVINARRRNKIGFTNSVIIKEKPYKCKICKKKFSTKYYLYCHILLHSGKSPHKCRICNKMFTQQNHLSKHMLSHTGVKNFKCDICSRKFLRKSILSTHMLTHSKKEFKCNICYMKFTLKSTLDKHMSVHSRSKPYTCSVCGENFCQRFILDEHFQIHLEESSYSCLICGKRFIYKSYLQQHMVTHSTARPYQCSKCGKAFNRSFTFERHMKAHNGTRAYKCKSCDMRCRDRYTLKIHMLTHNTNKRPSIPG